MISTRKIYIFKIDETFRDKDSRYYSVKLICEYESSIVDYFKGFNDYLLDNGYRTNTKEYRYRTTSKEDILSFIEFVAKKWDITEYLIK